MENESVIKDITKPLLPAPHSQRASTASPRIFNHDLSLIFRRLKFHVRKFTPHVTQSEKLQKQPVLRGAGISAEGGMITPALLALRLRDQVLVALLSDGGDR